MFWNFGLIVVAGIRRVKVTVNVTVGSSRAAASADGENWGRTSEKLVAVEGVVT